MIRQNPLVRSGATRPELTVEGPAYGSYLLFLQKRFDLFYELSMQYLALSIIILYTFHESEVIHTGLFERPLT